jgi:hypothetical protein
MRALLNVVPERGGDDCIEIDYGKPRALVPDGDYRAVFLRYETKFLFQTGKVFLWFRIIEPGEHFGKELYRAYRVAVLQKGRFKVKRGSDLFEMLCRVLCLRLRRDRLSLLGLKQCVLRIRTRIVKRDYRRRPLPEWLYYSVADDVLSKETS